MKDTFSAGAAPQVTVRLTGELTAAEQQEVVDLCTRAFGQSFEGLFSYLDPQENWHVLARLDGLLVSHASCSQRWLQPEGYEPLRVAYVDAVATEPALQGRGLGSLVMQRLAEEIRGYPLGGLATERPSFYERLGWERWRGSLAVRQPDGQLLPTPGETVLILRTPRTPPLDLAGLLVADWRPDQPW